VLQRVEQGEPLRHIAPDYGVSYEAVRRLQGEVDLQPRGSGGTAIHLSVPLSLSTHRLLLVSCGGQSFAVPMHAIERYGRADLMRYRRDVFDDKYFRLRGDRPSKTIVSHLAQVTRNAIARRFPRRR